MKPVTLQIVSEEGIEATISLDGSHAGAKEYYAIVSVMGQTQNQKVFGIDPIQAFSLGLQLIEKLTAEKRYGKDEGPVVGARWRVEANQA